MLADHQLSLLGYDPSDPDSYDPASLAARPSLVHADHSDLLADPDAVVRRTLAVVTGDSAVAVIHFDVDAVDRATSR